MSESNKPGEINGRMVTDSIHERFRDRTSAFCEDCKVKIVSSLSEIEKHFNKNHPSRSKCAYCHENVYYYTLKLEDNGDETSTEKVFHRCGHGTSESERNQ
ncbi:hypothetical protein G9C98_004732 [Cotesia typhae]|uniref:Uncharacterized protein n=1 Tax=Cotesia typhae TaxID=2053667 RepID=A0A8J5UQL7_9HYME|nr:hypothetical protein G9C98_004732 [Cotesia typhae]